MIQAMGGKFYWPLFNALPYKPRALSPRFTVREKKK